MCLEEKEPQGIDNIDRTLLADSCASLFCTSSALGADGVRKITAMWLISNIDTHLQSDHLIIRRHVRRIVTCVNG